MRESRKDDSSFLKQPRRLHIQPAIRLAFSLLLLVTLGTALMALPWAVTRPFSLTDSAFTAVSALTVTGLSVITPSIDLTLFGQILLLILIQIGGVGYMVLAVTLLKMIGRQISLADRLALQDSLGLVSLGGLVQLTKAVLRTVLMLELIGAILLFAHWSTFLGVSWRTAWLSLFHSVSAFCNAGFDLFSGHPEHLSGLPTDDLSLTIMGTLIFLGSLGIPVLFDFVTWRKRHEFSLHSRITVPVVLTLVIVGAAAIYVSEALAGGVLVGQTWDQAILRSIFQSISCRSSGFVSLPNFTDIEPASFITITTLMFIGGSPASMGGGITTGTFSVMVLALVAYARGRDVPVFKGRAIPGEMTRKAAAVLSISIFVICAVSWLLALTHQGSLEEIAFEVTSAFSTCGLSLGFTSELDEFGRAMIMFMMFWGRLGALTLLVGLTRSKHPRRVRYPEERLLIG